MRCLVVFLQHAHHKLAQQNLVSQKEQCVRGKGVPHEFASGQATDQILDGTSQWPSQRMKFMKK